MTLEELQMYGKTSENSFKVSIKDKIIKLRNAYYTMPEKPQGVLKDIVEQEFTD